MRLSRTDLVPMLAIIGGGAFGVLTFGSFLLLWSPFNDVTAPDPVVAPFATAELVLTGDMSEVDPVEIPLPDGRWIPLYVPDTSGAPRVYVRIYEKDGTARADLSFRPDMESQERSLFYFERRPLR